MLTLSNFQLGDSYRKNYKTNVCYKESAHLKLDCSKDMFFLSLGTSCSAAWGLMRHLVLKLNKTLERTGHNA